ncbi:MAG TPA: protease pro-enzyme activation domain-containing protein [Polyangiaceae bacterium]
MSNVSRLGVVLLAVGCAVACEPSGADTPTGPSAPSSGDLHPAPAPVRVGPMPMSMPVPVPVPMPVPGTAPSALSDANLEVEVRTNSCGGNHVSDFLQVTNKGTAPVALSDITIKLWAYDTSGADLVPDVLAAGCTTSSPGCSGHVAGVRASAASFSPACAAVGDHPANWEITIGNTDAGELQPGEAWTQIHTELRLADGAQLSPGPADWYSPCVTGNGSDYAPDPHYAVYVQGKLVFSGGIAPPSCRAPHGQQQLSGYVRPPASTAPVTGVLDPSTLLHLAIGVQVQDRQGLRAFATRVSDPADPSYRQYLDQAQLDATVDPPPGFYQAVLDWAQSRNLSVVSTYPNRIVVDVSGTAADIERALYVNLVTGLRPDGSTFFELDREPSVDLGVPLLWVSGLDDFALPQHTGGSGPGGSYVSADFRTAYASCTTLKGENQYLGIMSYDGYRHTDVMQYESTTTGGNVPLNDVLLGGVSGAPTVAGDAETVTDVEMAIAMAPKLAGLTVFMAPDCSWQESILDSMATTTPRLGTLSTSFTCRMSAAATAIVDYMAAQGQSFAYPSGDSGAYPAAGLEWASEDAFVTVVGGTLLTMNGAGTSYSSEAPFNDPSISFASGGGCSAGDAQPAYQAGITLCPKTGGGFYRSVPDVVMVAQSVFIVSTLPLFNGNEGTSVATPLFAGFLALANQASAMSLAPPVGFASPAIYAIGNSSAYASSFHVVTGPDPSYQGGPTLTAGSGYNLASGWGSPQCALINELTCVKCGGSSCVDFSNDSANCGACLHSCGAGTCVQGQCNPPATVLAVTTTTPQGLAIDATTLYWSDGTNAMKMPKDGSSPPATLGQVAPFSEFSAVEPGPVAVDGANFYWFSAATAGFEQVSIGGGAPTFLAGGSNAASVASDGTHVFFDADDEIAVVPVGGGAETNIAPSTESFGMAIDSTNVYWTNTATFGVMKVPKAGGSPVVLATTSGFNPIRIAVDGTTVYFTTDGGPLMSVPIAGGSATTLTSQGVKAEGLAVDSTGVYWTGCVGNCTLPPAGVFTVPLGSISATPTQLYGTFSTQPMGIALDATFAYWTEDDSGGSTTGRVMRTTK